MRVHLCSSTPYSIVRDIRAHLSIGPFPGMYEKQIPPYLLYDMHVLLQLGIRSSRASIVRTYPVVNSRLVVRTYARTSIDCDTNVGVTCIMVSRLQTDTQYLKKQRALN